MNKAMLSLIAGAVIGAGAVWFFMRSHHGEEAAPPAEAAAAEEEATHITHDDHGNVVIEMSDEMQGDAGIGVANPVVAEFAPEIRGYGRVLDPAPIAEAVTDLASARATLNASREELARLKTLETQGNASTRSIQAAEAATQHDDLAVQSAQNRLAATLGITIARREDLPALVRALVAQEKLLIRVDLVAGQSISPPPPAARLLNLAGRSLSAEYLSAAPAVDPTLQGLGLLFLSQTNGFLVGEAVTAFLQLPEKPISGVIVRPESVVRTEGKGWIYVLNEGGESLTRREISLDRPTETGWFIHDGVSPADYIVVRGAQTLLSEELKATIVGD